MSITLYDCTINGLPAIGIDHKGNGNVYIQRGQPASASDPLDSNEEMLFTLASEVKKLRAEVARLSLFERAIASLASQFVHPLTTPEEFARDVLGEK